MKIALIGGVTSTRLTLDKLHQHGLRPHCVYGYEPQDTSLVSGYACLAPECARQDIAYVPFRRINDHVDEIAEGRYDVIFIVGLSQLVSERIIAHARLGCVGFHPTLLPRGRGRAPIAWLVLEESRGAANLFLIDREADAGPVFKQVPFAVAAHDDAGAVEAKALDALAEALDAWLPELKRGAWNPVPQAELLATEYGRRAPEDGWIDWHGAAPDIDRHIKASSRPHPGAYTFAGGNKVVVWKSRLETGLRIKGVVGRVLKTSPEQHLLVQAGQGLVWLTEYEAERNAEIRVGMRLGYYHELELYEMRRELDMIKGRLGL